MIAIFYGVHARAVLGIRPLLISNALNHQLELFEFDQTVAVLVNLSDDFFPDTYVSRCILAKNLSHLIGIDLATVILIEESESGPHILLAHSLGRINRCCAPFSKIDGTARVLVGLFKDLTSAFMHRLRVCVWIKFLVGLYELFLLYQTITIFIKLSEGLFHLSMLLLGCKMARQVGQRGLNHLRVAL